MKTQKSGQEVCVQFIFEHDDNFTFMKIKKRIKNNPFYFFIRFFIFTTYNN